MGIGQLMKRKRICDSRSVKNILDKRLRSEVQSAQTNGKEMVMGFVNVHLHCIVSNLKSISKFSSLPPLEKFLRTPMGSILFIFFDYLRHETECACTKI